MTQTAFDPNDHLLQLKSKQGSQDYLPVQWRLVWFRRECPQGTIETQEVEVDLDRVVEAESFVWNAEKRRSEKVIKQAKGYARFRAVVTDGKGGKATATGSECAADFGDFIEKAETKAVGRALAALGYGTQFAPEFQEGQRIVDAPVDFGSGDASNEQAPTTSQRSGAPTEQRQPKPAPITPVQGNQGATTGQVQRTEQSNGSTEQPSPRETKATEQAPVPPPKATEQQIESIRKVCQAVGMAEPKNLTEMPYFEAKSLFEQLTAEYKKQRLEQIKKRIEAVGVKWEDAKTDKKLRGVKDEDLTINQLNLLNTVAAEYEQNQATPKAS